VYFGQKKQTRHEVSSFRADGIEKIRAGSIAATLCLCPAVSADQPPYEVDWPSQGGAGFKPGAPETCQRLIDFLYCLCYYEIINH